MKKYQHKTKVIMNLMEFQYLTAITKFNEKEKNTVCCPIYENPSLKAHHAVQEKTLFLYVILEENQILHTIWQYPA